MLAKLRNYILPVGDILSLIPQKGTVYEIGCGYGSLAAEIARSRPHCTVRGIDIDKSKINRAKDMYTYKNLDLVQANSLTYEYKQGEAITMSDFLHHIGFEDQISLLKKVKSILKPGGVVIMKEIDLADGWRMIASRLWDLLLYPHDKIYYRSKKEWVNILRKIGFSVEVKRRVSWFPGSTFLYECHIANA